MINDAGTLGTLTTFLIQSCDRLVSARKKMREGKGQRMEDENCGASQARMPAPLTRPGADVPQPTFPSVPRSRRLRVRISKLDTETHGLYGLKIAETRPFLIRFGETHWR